MWGVLAHGGIVTLTAVVCAVCVIPSWWPYALLIGTGHTAIDVVRARLIKTTDTGTELAWYLLDQVMHLTVITLAVAWSSAPWRAASTELARLLTNPRLLVHAIGYLLLLNPAWVFLRMAVRGVWGAGAAPHLGAGEKFAPMAERVLIASCVLVGQFALVPWILLARRLVTYRVQGRGVGILVRLTAHWAETLLSALLAMIVGVILRALRTM